MRKFITASFAILAALAVLGSPFLAFSACNWIYFGVQNKCDDESCGIGCEIEEYGPT